MTVPFRAPRFREISEVDPSVARWALPAWVVVTDADLCLRPINGRSLLERTVTACRAARAIGDIIIASHSAHVRHEARRLGVTSTAGVGSADVMNTEQPALQLSPHFPWIQAQSLDLAASLLGEACERVDVLCECREIPEAALLPHHGKMQAFLDTTIGAGQDPERSRAYHRLWSLGRPTGRLGLLLLDDVAAFRIRDMRDLDHAQAIEKCSGWTTIGAGPVRAATEN